jgi:hypothetical protein
LDESASSKLELQLQPKYLMTAPDFRTISPTAKPPPSHMLKRVGVIGEVGVDKSLLMNCLTGVKYYMNDFGGVEKLMQVKLNHLNPRVKPNL